jgi:site-specific DNA-methyltransferase (adenine-specific)
MFFDDKKLHTQRIAFEDTWTYKNVHDSIEELHSLKHEDLWALLLVYQKVAPHAFPYLVMMSMRLLELHRVLKPTGSFYLHCDPTMSHYLKTLCDVIYGPKDFLNELIWCYRERGISKTSYNRKHDVILLYAKQSGHHTFHYERHLKNKDID